MVAVSSEAERLHRVMAGSSVAYAYFDSADRLVMWNEAYLALNIRITDLIRKGAVFADLLAELVLRGQIAIPEGKHEEWIAERLRARRYGTTAFRTLADGRTFLAQERKDDVAGTLGLWLDVSSVFSTGALQNVAAYSLRTTPDLGDPGIRDLVCTKLQMILGSLEFLSVSAGPASDREIIGDAACAARDLRDLLCIGSPTALEHSAPN